MTHLHPLLRILWPDDFDQSQRVYALLDGARDPAIHVALLRAKKAVEKLKSDNVDVQAGINIVLRALETPIRQIAENAGFANYRDYAFRAKGRFDYTPADCEKFHAATEKPWSLMLRARLRPMTARPMTPNSDFPWVLIRSS